MKFILTALIAFFSLCALAETKKVEMSLELAQKISAKVEACGKENKWKLSVAVVNSEGNLILFHRGDDTYVGSIDAAIDKAKSANAFQRSTKAFVDGLKDGRTGLMTIKNIVGIEGGLLIKVGEQFLGAVGVSGARSTEDEICANAGLKVLKP